MQKPIIPHEVINAVNVKEGDTIIHESNRFVVQSVDYSIGCGNDFGNGIYVTGKPLLSNVNIEPKNIWLFAGCPIIKVLDHE